VEDVTNLYGVDINLAFAPGVLEALDAEPLKEGVQVATGSFFVPTDPSGVVANLVDNENGTVHYAVTLTDPQPAVSGTGVVFSINFHTKGLGISDLHVVSATLLTKEVVSIPVTAYDGSVRVQTLSYLPLIVKGQGR